MGHTCEFTRSHINSLHSNHLKELERICIIYLDNSQNLLSWNYIFCMDVRIIISFNTWIWIFKLKVRPSISIDEPTVVIFKNYLFCMDVRIIINFNTWIWIFNKLQLKVRPSISIEEPTVSFKKLSILHGCENHCHSIWILNKLKPKGFVRK